MKKSLIAVVLALSCLPFVAQAAENRGSYETASLDVPYADLNLRSAAGAQAMLNRIKSAANRVCGGRPHAQELRAKAAYKICVRDAVTNAVRRLNAPLVTAQHKGRSADPRYAYEGR